MAKREVQCHDLDAFLADCYARRAADDMVEHRRNAAVIVAAGPGAAEPRADAVIAGWVESLARALRDAAAKSDRPEPPPPPEPPQNEPRGH